MGFRSGGAESQIFRELIEKMIDEELEAQAASKPHVSVRSLKREAEDFVAVAITT